MRMILLQVQTTLACVTHGYLFETRSTAVPSKVLTFASLNQVIVQPSRASCLVRVQIQPVQAPPHVHLWGRHRGTVQEKCEFVALQMALAFLG